MQKWILFCLFVLNALSVRAYQYRAEGDPAAIARRFTIAVNKLEFGKARAICTKEVAAEMNKVQYLTSFVERAKKDKMKNRKVHVISTEVKGDQCTVRMTNGGTKPYRLFLVKENDKWLVSAIE